VKNIRIRQICLIAHDLDRVQTQLGAVFGVEVCHRVEGGFLGLHNCLIPFGNQFVEIVSPKPDEHGSAGERFLRRRGGDGGYMVITQVPADTFKTVRDRVEAMGIRIVGEFGDDVNGNGFQLHPRDVPGAIPEIQWHVEEDRSDSPWWNVGPNWWQYKHTEIVAGIAAAEIQCNDPARLAARWSDVFEKPVDSDGNGNPCLTLQESELRFVPVRDGRGEGLGALDISSNDRQRALTNAEDEGCRTGENLVTICGMRLNLV
jgi:hypothetical protein|tara:strand:- start:424 stop:1203 length:780 start_codon:yes stop_codon:yes gene_type:complete